MPEVYVYAVEGRTLDQKRALVKDVTDAVVRSKESKAKGGFLFADRPPG